MAERRAQREKWRILAWLCESQTQAGDVFREPARSNGLAQSPHQFLIVEQVVESVQVRAEDLVDPLQVMQVGAREIAAGMAGARRIQGAGVIAIARITQPNGAIAGKYPAIPGIAGGQDAIEHV